MKTSTPLLSVKNLTFSYHKNFILNEINFDVEKGNIYGLIGPNGVGKTTLIKLILDLLSYKIGEIKCFGSFLKNNRIEILQKIGSSIEYPSLYKHLNAYDNIKIYATYYNLGKEKIENSLNLVNLWDKKAIRVKNFSMGMKQKLALAISLIHDPELIILDEPTNGLDPNANFEMIQLLKTLNEGYNKTIFLSSHKLNDLQKLCTHIGILKKGKLVYNDILNKNNEANFNLEDFYFEIYK